MASPSDSGSAASSDVEMASVDDRKPESREFTFKESEDESEKKSEQEDAKRESEKPKKKPKQESIARDEKSNDDQSNEDESSDEEEPPKKTKQKKASNSAEDNKKSDAGVKKRKALKDDASAAKDPRRSPLMTTQMFEKVKEKDLFPLQVHFRDLNFSVKNSKKKKKSGEWKQILHSVGGTFEPGTLTAIMGPSGAGKTTLLNVLAGRTKGKLTGTILLNGVPREEAGRNIMKHIAYVMQDDILMKTQTARFPEFRRCHSDIKIPREILTFSSLLRMPNTYTKEQKLQKVDEILTELNLTKVQHTQVGAPGVQRGLSGGERKRVAIGVELVTNPSLLFLDEPTSGLDSFTAENVVDGLKDLAKAGRTIVATIHQPNSEIFRLFDNLMLLAKGRVVYWGPTSAAPDYFKSIGYPIPPFTNPADHLMKITHVDPHDPATEERANDLIRHYEESSLAQKERDVVVHRAPPQTKTHHEPEYAQGVFTQMLLIMQRNFRDILREPLKIRAAIGQTIFLSVLIGLIYLQLDNDSSSVQDRLGSLFFILINQAMAAVLSLVNLFPSERPVVIRENANHMYRTTAYYLGKVLSDFPLQILIPALFATITYWMVGYKREAEAYFIFMGIVILAANVGASAGLIIGILAKDSTVAIALVPIVLIPFMVFSGFLVNSENVPVYFIWVPYISFIKWAFQAIAINEFTGLEFTCADDKKIFGKCAIETGEQVLDLYDLNGDIATSAVVLAGMYLVLRILAYIALLVRVKRSSAGA